MVDAQPAGVPQGRPQGLNERPVSRRAELVRNERRQAPILPLPVIYVRRGADRASLRVEVCARPTRRPRRGRRQSPGLARSPYRPGSAPIAGRAAIAAIDGSDADRGCSQQRLRRPVRRRRAAWPARCAPIGAVVLGQDAVRGKLLQVAAALAAEAIKRGVEFATSPDLFERLHLQAEDHVTVNHAVVVQCPTRCGQRFQFGAECSAARHFFNTQVEWAKEPAAAGIVRARLLRNDWGRGGDRVDQHQAGALAFRPLGQAPQIGQIAKPPACLRASGIKLSAHPKAPRAATGNGPA